MRAHGIIADMKTTWSLARLEATAIGMGTSLLLVMGITAHQLARPSGTGTTGALVATSILVLALTVRMLMRHIGDRLDSASRRLESVAGELGVATRQQSQTAQRHYQSMAEITTTIRELLVTSQQIAGAAQRTAQLSTDAAASSRTGDHRVTSTHEALTLIRQQVTSIVEHMQMLESRSQQVKGILEIINELSDQTNILSLNATIEAVSAGTFGSRFAVIADEVRKLSDRVSGSTRDIRQLLEQINSAVSSTLAATESGARSVELGTQRFNETVIAFHSIAVFVDSAHDEARDIELSTKQQATAMDQVHHAVDEISRSGRDIEDAISQARGAIAELGSISQELGRLRRASPNP